MGVYFGERQSAQLAFSAGIRDAIALVLRPRQFIAHQDIDARRRLHTVLRGLKWRELRDRKRDLELLPRNLAPIPESVGFRWVDDVQPEVIAGAVREGQQRWARLDLDGLRRGSSSPHLIAKRLDFDSVDDPLLALALHPGLIRMIGEYMGSLPILQSCGLLYSPNTEICNSSSQFFHLDGQDVRTLQLFLYLHDVEPANGPMVAYRADASERFARLIRYRKVGHTQRVADSLIEQHLSAGERQAFNGPEGSLLACDTDRCFHYGSRGASRPRFVVALQYVSAAGFSVPLRRNRLHALPRFGRLQPWQVKVLHGSLDAPVGGATMSEPRSPI